MKQFRYKYLIMTLLLCLVYSNKAFAYVEYNGLHYNILSESDKTVELIPAEGGSTTSRYNENYNTEKVNIPASIMVGKESYTVSRIGGYAFYYCTGLTSITIPNSVTSIGYWAFKRCSTLASITIPNSVTSIGDWAFSYCPSLNSIIVEDGNPNYDSRNKCNALIKTSTNTLEFGCKNTIIPNSVTSIGYGAFEGCSTLAFITIPNSVTSISGSAFNNCSALTSMTIPNSVTYIGGRVLNNCPSLNSIIVEKGNPNYDSRDKCNALIKTSTNTLIAGCRNTIIPNSVTSIGDYAFEGCSTLASISIPNSVTSIGDWAFVDCGKLKNVYCHAESTPSAGIHAFGGVNAYSVYLYVPENSLSAYKTTSPWSSFGKILSLKIQKPIISYSNNEIKISCETPDTKIYYTLDGTDPRTDGKLYTSPVYIEKNCTVKAFAIGDFLEASDVVTYTVNSYTCEPVSEMAYNGRYLTFATTTPNAEIHYTLDGSTPKKTSAKYTKAIDVKGITTVRAIVTRDNYNDSKESTYSVTYYFDGNTVSLSNARTIVNAFEWCGTDNIEKLIVNGNIDGSDISFISSLLSLRHLNMEDANVSGNAISAGAFAGSKFVSVSLPKTLTSVGNGLFTGCDNLAAIVWNANVTLPSSVLNGISNPNLLLYVKLNSYAPSSVKNVVANGVADNIVLYDGEGNNNFYVPQAFTAKRIAYSHNYSQKTIIGKCAGWETIALPFDVQTITHSKNGGISPFAANDATAKPFWLYSLGDFGFTAATKIKANTPYIISMPNNMDYADEYILGGDVTFSAENVTVPVTTQSAASKGEFRFIPTTMNVEQDAQVYAINKGMEYQGQHPGSMFVGDIRSVAPFEAYLTLSSQMAKANVISLTDLGFDDNATGIDIPTKKNGMKVWSTGATIYISTDKAKAVSIYSVSGTLIRTVELHEGVNAIKGITPGMYVVGQTKVSVK